MDSQVRRILHVDMDAFFASVEQRDAPALRGCPVAVGGRHRGVVAAASYEARRFGVRSAMPMSQALRLCPDLVVVPPNFEKYREASGQVFELFRQVTPLVEPLSLDEAYLDVTVNSWGETLGTAVAQRLKAAIRERTGLSASAGVAPNKFLAKIASGYRKPDGLTVISPERVERFLAGLDVDALWGVGPVTAEKLRAAGFHKLTDLRGTTVERLRTIVGSFAETLLALAHGIDHRPVEPSRERKSVGSETTFPEDLRDRERIDEEARQMARECAAWLSRHERTARTVTLKLRYQDFQTITRSESSRSATDDAEVLAARAVALLARTEAGTRPVRLLGVSLSGLESDAADGADTTVSSDRDDIASAPAAAAVSSPPSRSRSAPGARFDSDGPQLSFHFPPNRVSPAGGRDRLVEGLHQDLHHQPQHGELPEEERQSSPGLRASEIADGVERAGDEVDAEVGPASGRRRTHEGHDDRQR